MSKFLCSPIRSTIFMRIFGVFLLLVFNHPLNVFGETDLNRLVTHYEVLNYSSVEVHKHQRVRRSVTATHPSIRIPIFAFQKNLTLLVVPDSGVINPQGKIIIGGKVQHGGLGAHVTHMYRGKVENYPNSVAYGSIINGVFRGTISVDSISDSYYVEPAGNFFDHQTPFHSVIYHDEHVIHPHLNRVRRSSSDILTYSFCGLSNPKIAERMMKLTKPISGSSLNAEPVHSRRIATRAGRVNINENYPDASNPTRHRKNIYANISLNPFADRHSDRLLVTGASSTRVCNLYLQSDTFLWERIITMQHIRGNRELAVQEITSIFTQHVQGAQAIYQHTLFRDHSGRLEYPGISFRVDLVLINVTEEDCKRRPSDFNGRNGASSPPFTPTALPRGTASVTNKSDTTGSSSSAASDTSNLSMPPHGSYADENPFCAENIDVTNYLNLHSYTHHNDFCLAYVFTYRDFSGGTLGLAWVAEPSGSGGVCEKHRLMREGSHNVYKSLNTGVVTLLNYGSRVALKVSQLTFAHEMGHNFGAKHDDDHKAEPYGCLPSVDDPRGNYIMFASATSGDKDNNNKFSLCSSDSIARLLDRVLSSDSNCFLSSDGPFCGNQLTEEGEQCDCGFTRHSCRDQCCHPKESANPCQLTDKILVNSTSLKVQCSPTAGECCTHDCQYRGQIHLCRGAGECHRSAFCDGVAARCPLSENLPDGTPCQDHTRVCKQGQCLGSICERIPGWHECSLTRDTKVTREMMCYVACRENRTGAPCISTFQLEQDTSLQTEYPQLVAELLRHGQGTRLKPGAPCDNYRGYCDVFHRCRSVEAEGPLARLRDLLFSPQMLEKVKSWVTRHWWAVILICLSAIISMIIFVKLCAASTPPSRLDSRPAHRPLTGHRGRRHEINHSVHPAMRLPDDGQPTPIAWPPNATSPVTSHWVWPRRGRGRGRRSSEPRSSRTRIHDPPPGTYLLQPSAPPMENVFDSSDFPPAHARPIPIGINPRPTAGGTAAYLVAGPDKHRGDGNSQMQEWFAAEVTTRDRPSGSRVPSAQRPMSMLIPMESLLVAANCPSSASSDNEDHVDRPGRERWREKKKKKKNSKPNLPSKLRGPSGRPRQVAAISPPSRRHRPMSVAYPIEFMPLSACAIAAPLTPVATAAMPPHGDSGIPPPAYDDLPLRGNRKPPKRRSASPNRP